MTASDRANALATLLAALRKKYRPEPAPSRTPMEELLHAMALWESTTARAERAYKRLLDSFVDLNELRVSRPDEIAEVFGKTYPLAEDRSRRLLAALESIFAREHAVSLDAAAASGKRDARKYLDAIESLPPFVIARVAVLRLDGHAVPLEQRTVDALVAAGVLEEGTDLARAVGQMERLVKAAESVEFALLLQAWTDDGLPAMGKGAKKPLATRKKSATTAVSASGRKKAPANKAGSPTAKQRPSKKSPGKGD